MVNTCYESTQIVNISQIGNKFSGKWLPVMATWEFGGFLLVRLLAWRVMFHVVALAVMAFRYLVRFKINNDPFG